MTRIPLTIAMTDYDHVRDVMCGRVTAEGLDLTCLTLQVEEIFFRFLVHKEWDGSEVSFAKYAAKRADGDDSLIALPIFPSRMFRHGSFYVRKDGKIRAPADLKGKRVGIPEWAQTAAVYTRGYLQHQFGVDLASIEWVQAGTNEPGRTEKVDLNLPKGVRLTRAPDKSLNEMLLAGEIDAVTSARPPDAFTARDPRVMRLFPNFMQVEAEYYRTTGIFPIMHTFALRKDVLEKNPWVARSLYKAFDTARERGIARALDATISMLPLPWGSEYARAEHERFGSDYFPYGIEPNRKTLSAFLTYAHEQGVCKRLLTVEELFPKAMTSSFKV